MSYIHTRELTAREKHAIRKLATTMCANFDHEYGCLPLDEPCYMLTIAFNTSNLCKYFRNVVLPLDPALKAVFNGQPRKPCKWCGRKFPVNGRQVYCSDTCAHAARLKTTAARVRRHRRNNGLLPKS